MTTAIRLTLLPLDTATARGLADHSDPAAGRIVVSVRPDTRRTGWIARDLLAAVGARTDVVGRRARDADDRQLAVMWLAAHDIRDVLVLGVETLGADLLTELVEVTALIGASLWLLADHILPDELTDALEVWPLVPCPPEEFSQTWDPTGRLAKDDAQDPEPAPAHEPLPEVLPEVLPHVDFAVFRATARRQLAPDDFALVDRLYLAVARDAERRLTTGDEPVEVLRDLLGACRDASEATVTTRAVQAAAFRLGIHLRVDLTALLAFDDYAPVAAASDPATWRQLAAYAQPHRQAACVLTLLDVPPADQSSLTLADLDVEDLRLHTDGVWRELPPEAGAAFRALRLSRLAVGADAGDPLLAHLDGSPVSARTLADAVTAVQRETGTRLTVGQVERVQVPASTWARRRAITAARLEVAS